MTTRVTKTFEFSASHTEGSKIVGHNYTLRTTFIAPDARLESGLQEKIERSLIQKVHSMDLGEHVDFLKGVAPNGPELLKAFWAALEPVVRPSVLCSLSLEQDRRTLWTISSSV